MEFSTTSESSTPASVEAPSATPAPAAESTPAADASLGREIAPSESATLPTQSGETVAGSQGEEFPDDVAFQQLPGEQRASNWAKARGRIGELNRRVEELSGLETHKPAIEAIEQAGGWDSVEPLLQLAASLNAPVVGEDGEPVVDPTTGLPQYTAEPFVNALANQSIGTLYDVALKAFDVPYGQETLGHLFMRNRLGLDPSLLSTYQQIRSPEQAREYITRSGGIDPGLYEGVNPEYHDALKSLMQTRPGLSQQWEHLDDDAREELLQDRRELLENRKYAEEQRRRDEEAVKDREAASRRRIEEAASNSINSANDRVHNAQLAKLKQTARFFADDADNTDVWNEILSRSAQDVIGDQTLKSSLDNWRAWHMQLAGHEANRDILKASQARVEIGKLERKIEKAFADYVTTRTGQWSRRLGGARAVQQQQIQDAKPRIEIGGNGDVSNGSPPPAYSAPPPGQRFGMNEERKRQLAAEARARNMGRG